MSADCEHLDSLMEGLADGSVEPSAVERAHLDGCARCQARLDQARELDRFLMAREVFVPPATFTTGVMALVGRDRWRTERVVDLGFNLAMAAGVLIILAGIGGLAWSLGFLTITIDFAALASVAQSELAGPVRSQVQTIAMAAAVLSMALGLWWWAEADSSF